MGKQKDNAAADGTSRLEWLAAALGALIVGGALAYMIYYGLSHPQGPPALAVRETAVTPSGSGHLVQFSVENRGHSTAAGVLVGGELRSGGAAVEESEATLDYVPEHSARAGGLIFTRDPSGYELQLRVKGYRKP